MRRDSKLFQLRENVTESSENIQGLVSIEPEPMTLDANVFKPYNCVSKLLPSQSFF